MQYNLTIVDRMILESLQAKSQNLFELENATRIGKEILNKSMTSLISQNIIVKKESLYSLNPNINERIKNELNDKINLMCEVNEIINSCIRKTLSNTNETSFKLKKVNMTEREEKIYKGLLYNLESFINSLNKTSQIADQKVIFWGEGKYENIKNSILNY